MTELQQAIDALVTPESQAFADYINGGGLDQNPYKEESEDHDIYDDEMARLLRTQR
jgi:hypothetical protein